MSMLATVLGACLRKGHTGLYFRGNHIYPTCLMVLLLLFETSTGEYFYFRNIKQSYELWAGIRVIIMLFFDVDVHSYFVVKRGNGRLTRFFFLWFPDGPCQMRMRARVKLRASKQLHTRTDTKTRFTVVLGALTGETNNLYKLVRQSYVQIRSLISYLCRRSGRLTRGQHMASSNRHGTWRRNGFSLKMCFHTVRGTEWTLIGQCCTYVKCQSWTPYALCIGDRWHSLHPRQADHYMSATWTQ